MPIVSGWGIGKSLTPENAKQETVETMVSRHTFKISLSSTCTTLICISLLALSSGCMSLNSSITEASLPGEPAGASSGRYQVVMKGGFSKVSTFEGELVGPVTVQDAINQAGATDKFRGMSIEVHRIVKESGTPIKLPVDYQSRNKQVKSEQNYALHPNDRIVISAASRNPIDKFVNALATGG